MSTPVTECSPPDAAVMVYGQRIEIPTSREPQCWIVYATPTDVQVERHAGYRSLDAVRELAYRDAPPFCLPVAAVQLPSYSACVFNSNIVPLGGDRP